MAFKRKLGWASIFAGLVLFAGLIQGPSPLLAQDVVVSLASPSESPQGTVNLNVLVKGKGFKKGAVAKWLVTGSETDLGGVTVNFTTFVSATDLIANITVASDAQTVKKYDIRVTLSGGRTGKGIELFKVISGGNACSEPTPILSAPVNCFLASGGCLDTTFGVNGLALINTTGSEPVVSDQEQAWDIAIQSDGKIIGAGYRTNRADATGSDFALVRYNPDGNMDTTFGTGGFAQIVLPSDQQFSAVLIQPDGKIVAAGNGNPGYGVARFNPDGSLDSSFGSGGITSIPLEPGSGKRGQRTLMARFIALQADGKILVTGEFAWLVRLNPDGSLDSSFGSGGKLQAPIGTSQIVLQNVQVGALTEERILVGGSGGGPTGGAAVIRLLPSGSLDTSFGPNANGTVFTDYCGEGGSFIGVALDGNGNIVAGGSARGNFAIARYSPNGILDTSFGDPSSGSGGPGKTVVDPLIIGPLGDTNAPKGLMVQADGKYILTGYVSNSGTQVFFTLMRFNSDGTLDTSFGTGGVVVPDFGPGNHYGIKGRIQSDGKILMGGAVEANGGYNFAVARFWP